MRVANRLTPRGHSRTRWMPVAAVIAVAVASAMVQISGGPAACAAPHALLGTCGGEALAR